jgi:anti-sigma factor RsiW
VKLPEPPLSDHWLDERLEAFVDGELPEAEHEAFESLAADPTWSGRIHTAVRIRDGLRSLPIEACPEHVTRAVLAEARRRNERWHPGRVVAWIDEHFAPLWQPVVAMTALLAIVVGSLFVGRAPETFAERAEVEQALADVRWTLAYLSEVGRQTGETVRHDVIENRVVQPVRQALGARAVDSADQKAH